MDFNYREYRLGILSHLSEYKNNVLKIKKNGMDTRYKKEYSHILPKGNEYRNIIHSEYGMELWDLIKKFKIKLHKEFHHLNSSQALCFNLFYPIIKENRFDLLLEKNENIIGWEFEFVPDKKEKTNFDVFIQTNENNYFFELKYTEDKFSSKKITETSLERFKNIYEIKMEKFNNVTSEIFLKNYQVFRNLSYIDNGIINFVIPKTRSDLNIELNEIIKKYCNNVLKQRINIIYIEDIVNKAISQKKLEEYYKLLSEKYVNK